VAEVAVEIHGHVQTGESFFSSPLSIAGQLAGGEQDGRTRDLADLEDLEAAGR
jgi:hypothetical protein